MSQSRNANQEQSSRSLNQDFVTLEEAAQILGLSTGTMYQYTFKKVITYYKPNGRKIYFKMQDLQDFMERGKRTATDEIKSQAVEDTLKRG